MTMNKRMTDLSLPPFAWLSSGGHDGSNLNERNVMMHIRSASIIEIFQCDDVVLNEGVISYKFGYVNRYGIKEKCVAALHYCGVLDQVADREMILEEIIKPSVEWYRAYCDWEDINIENERGFQ
jgi:hypothetical protein